MEEDWKRGDDVVRTSLEIALSGQKELALGLVDEAIDEAITGHHDTWIAALCGQGAVIAHALGDSQREIDYMEKSLRFAQDGGFAAYNLAQLLLSDGQVERSKDYALKAYNRSVVGTTEADRDLTAAILKQWPSVAGNMER